jgi:hypothetical protein
LLRAEQTILVILFGLLGPRPTRSPAGDGAGPTEGRRDFPS